MHGPGATCGKPVIRLFEGISASGQESGRRSMACALPTDAKTAPWSPEVHGQPPGTVQTDAPCMQRNRAHPAVTSASGCLGRGLLKQCHKQRLPANICDRHIGACKAMIAP